MNQLAVGEVPVDGSPKAFGGESLGGPVEERTSFVDDRLGVLHVGVVEGVLTDFRFLAELRGEGVDHRTDGDRVVAASKVDHLEADGFQGRDGAAGDVINVGEVTGLAAVAVERDGSAFVDPANESQGRHVGTSGGTVNGEVADDRGIDAVEVMPRKGHRLGPFLRGGVGRDRAIDRLVLGKR